MVLLYPSALLSGGDIPSSFISLVKGYEGTKKGQTHTGLPLFELLAVKAKEPA